MSRWSRPRSAWSRRRRGGRAAGAACPDCGCLSDRVHDRYQRRLKDLPLAEQCFVIRLTAQRFICGSADRPRRRSPSRSPSRPPRTHG
ncbi:transposase family protein [Streptomyces filipinensis]|uniref:transposase family protein n=1 Tax=Streptomyces filipinensis TaxID=66887 RepID=UPI001E2C8AF1|nr:transposase family protein [Streptomyces filipinensis]